MCYDCPIYPACECRFPEACVEEVTSEGVTE
jgi:hypothetical protein